MFEQYCAFSDYVRTYDIQRSEGLLESEASRDPRTHPDMTADLVRAVLSFLARSPAMLLEIQPEDVLGQTDQVNLPGTLASQHPNWRRKLTLDLEEWPEDARFQALNEAVGPARAPARAAEAAGHAGTLLETLVNAGLTIDVRQLHAGAGVPAVEELGEIGGLIVLGGSMNADQAAEFPFIDRERRLLAALGVDDALDGLREQHSTYVNVDEDRGLADGDYGSVAFKSTSTEEGAEPVEMNDVLVDIGGTNTLPQFTENLRGAKAGETRSFDVTYPEDFGEQRLPRRGIGHRAANAHVRRLGIGQHGLLVVAPKPWQVRGAREFRIVQFNGDGVATRVAVLPVLHASFRHVP